MSNATYPQANTTQGGMYDEFGNYIGGANDSDDSSSEASSVSENAPETHEQRADDDDEPLVEREPSNRNSTAIVLHEDKEIYADASEVYGDQVETLLEQEDTVPITEPILKHSQERFWDSWEEKQPQLTYSLEYSSKLMETPHFVRNIAVCGHLHSGKTSLVDLFVAQTHPQYAPSDADKSTPPQLRYTDYRFDEIRRKISTKSSPMSLLLPNSKGKNYVIHTMDCPGHPNFTDESAAAMALSDGVLLVVDAVEGVMMFTEKVLELAVRYNLPIVLLINKIDRLILELRLPPQDAYQKIRHTLTQINKKLQALGSNIVLSPTMGNVCFGSTLLQFTFSLHTFAKVYSDYFKKFDPNQFAKRLWGAVYFNEDTRTFSPRPSADSDTPVTFVRFILEPLYKIISHVVGEKPKDLQRTLNKIGVRFSLEKTLNDSQLLLQNVLRTFFSNPTMSIIDMVTQKFPSPAQGAATKLRTLYTGPLNSPFVHEVAKCDAQGPLLIYIAKLYHNKTGEDFWALGRVLSGTIHKGVEVKVLGPNYTPETQEDLSLQVASRVMLHNSRYQIDMNQVPAGNWVLLEGVDAKILKCATIVAPNNTESYACAPLQLDPLSVVKVAVEPLNPNELPKMVDGIRRVNKSYPSLITKVEESGEHVLIGTGELYIDSVMMDLRKLYANIEIKISDPVVSFCETVAEMSSLRCYANSTNQENQLTMAAQPLEPGLAEDIERGRINIHTPLRELAAQLKEYDWDLLGAKSLWAFGPEPLNGPNVLLNETFPDQVDETALGSIRDSVVQGFRWATKEGPLCDEPIRNVKFKVLDATISPDPLQRGSGQVIPASRRVCYSSFLTASPRMMEPVYRVQIQTPMECIKAIYEVLERRRGHVLESDPIPATPFYTIEALVPVMDSFGLETDLRVQTQGMAFCLSTFHNWAIVPGDPLDESIELKPLEPAPAQFLAREFMIKTRRRKGLGGQPSIRKYFDVDMAEDFERQNDDVGSYMQSAGQYF